MHQIQRQKILSDEEKYELSLAVLESIMDTEPQLLNGIYLRETRTMYIYEDGYSLRGAYDLSLYKRISRVDDNDKYFTLLCHKYVGRDRISVLKISKEVMSGVISRMIRSLKMQLQALEPAVVDPHFDLEGVDVKKIMEISQVLSGVSEMMAATADMR